MAPNARACCMPRLSRARPGTARAHRAKGVARVAAPLTPAPKSAPKPAAASDGFDVCRSNRRGVAPAPIAPAPKPDAGAMPRAGVCRSRRPRAESPRPPPKPAPKPKAVATSSSSGSSSSQSLLTARGRPIPAGLAAWRRQRTDNGGAEAGQSSLTTASRQPRAAAEEAASIEKVRRAAYIQAGPRRHCSRPRRPRRRRTRWIRSWRTRPSTEISQTAFSRRPTRQGGGRRAAAAEAKAAPAKALDGQARARRRSYLGDTEADAGGGERGGGGEGGRRNAKASRRGRRPRKATAPSPRLVGR